MKTRLFLLPLVSLIATVLFSSISHAQTSRPRGDLPGGGIYMLMNKAIQKDVDITPEQLEDLDKLRKEHYSAMRNAYSSMQDVPLERRRAMMEKIREKQVKRTANLEKKVNNILMPIQSDRLKQIFMQQQIRAMGFSGIVNSDALAKELGLTEKQEKELRAKAMELQKSLQERMVQLRKEAHAELFKVLTPEQQAKIKKITAEPFEYPRYTPPSDHQPNRSDVRRKTK